MLKPTFIDMLKPSLISLIIINFTAIILTIYRFQIKTAKYRHTLSLAFSAIALVLISFIAMFNIINNITFYLVLSIILLVAIYFVIKAFINRGE